MEFITISLEAAKEGLKEAAKEASKAALEGAKKVAEGAETKPNFGKLENPMESEHVTLGKVNTEHSEAPVRFGSEKEEFFCSDLTLDRLTNDGNVEQQPNPHEEARDSELPDDSGKETYDSELPDDSGKETYDSELPDDTDIKTEAIDLEKMQELADNAAQEYNKKYTPYERMINKGYTDVSKTPNGGVSFENSDCIYCTENGEKGIVKIEASGNRTKDFDNANSIMGFEKTPEGYVWHHKDDYDVKTNTCTLELVKDDAHNASKPHSGACAQYDAVYGSNYNR